MKGFEESTTKGCIYMPRKYWKFLRMEAAERGMSMGQIIVEALESRIFKVKR